MNLAQKIYMGILIYMTIHIIIAIISPALGLALLLCVGGIIVAMAIVSMLGLIWMVLGEEGGYIY